MVAGQSFLGYYGHNSNFGDRGKDGDESWDDYDGSGDMEGSGSGDEYQEEFTPPCVGKYQKILSMNHLISRSVYYLQTEGYHQTSTPKRKTLCWKVSIS